jgi:hypothetical protein
MAKSTRSGAALLKAEQARAVAERNPDDMIAGIAARRADRAIAEINTRLPEGAIDVGVGGELVAVNPALAFMNTVQKPNVVSRDASADRLALANAAGSLELCLDVADTIGAANSFEKMAAHLAASAYRLSMKLMAQVSEHLDRVEGFEPFASNEARHRTKEACRVANTAARLHGAVVDTMVAVTRSRGGNKQVVRVEHVAVTNVGDGGQAVIAGRVTGRGSRRKSRGGSGQK